VDAHGQTALLVTGRNISEAVRQQADEVAFSADRKCKQEKNGKTS